MKNIIKLPEPEKNRDYPLMKALENRRTTRRWKDSPVPLQEISNILWAACGITRAKKGKTKSKRTAPSACNSQEISVYVLMGMGVFRYEEEIHSLAEVTPDDLRSYIGTQKMMKFAPLGLVYVADMERLTSPVLTREKAKDFSAWIDTGFIGQNVYLYCASAGLGTVAIALFDQEKLHKFMGLGREEKIVLTQAVGYLL